MTQIDHDAIAARVRQDRETGTPGPWQSGIIEDGGPFAVGDRDCWPICKMAAAPGPHNGANARRIAALPDLEAAYLDLYDEVQRLRAERDRFEAALGRACQVGGTTYLCERAEKAEAQRIAEWNKRRDAEASLVLEKAVCLTAEAERDRLRDALANIAVMGFDNDPAVSNAIAKSAVNQAREALKGDTK